MMDNLRKSVNKTVNALFSNGMTPLKHYGIDGDKIDAIEKQHPHVAKQYPHVSA